MTLITSYCFEKKISENFSEAKIWFTVILGTFKSPLYLNPPPPIMYSFDNLSNKVAIFWSHCFIDTTIIPSYMTPTCPSPQRISKHFINHIVIIKISLLPTDKYPLLRLMQPLMVVNFRGLF